MLDMLVQPVMMLVAAPLLLRSLGPTAYGTWMLVNSIAATIASLGGGFGDATIKSVSEYRGKRDEEGVGRSIGTALCINSMLGGTMAIVLIACARVIVSGIFHLQGELLRSTVVALRVGALVLLTRHIEAVFSAVLKAYERYAPAVLISSVGKFAIVIAAVVLAWNGHGLVSIMTATLLISMCTLTCQCLAAFAIGEVRPSTVVADSRRFRELGRFGAFTWLKSISGVGFSYADRLLVGAVLGMSPLAYYTLCVQAAQLIPGLSAAGLHFMFPRMSAQLHRGDTNGALESYRQGLRITIFLALGALIPWIFAKLLLNMWLGPQISTLVWPSFAVIVAAHAVLTLSVVPQYAALALDKAHWLALINLVAAAGALIAGAVLMKWFGLVGAGGMKMVAALISLSVFWIVASAFRKGLPAENLQLCAPATLAADD